MKRGPFGGTGLEVSTFGLGCARIGGIFQGDASGFLRLLARAHDAGINFFDTADMYSQGESETLVGKAFRGRRERVIIASKAGYRLPGQRKLAARLKPLLRPLIRRLGLRRERLPAAVRGSVSQDFSPDYLRRAAEASLRRLRTDYLDLLQLHSPPVEVVRRGEWVGELESLKRRGLIRHYGVACDDVTAGSAALEKAGVASIQFVVNLLERRASETLIPEVRARRVAYIARECLANGLLIKDPASIDWSKYTSSEEAARSKAQELEALREQAASLGVSLATLALKYVSELDGVSVTLVGARSLEQLNELLRILPG